MIKKISVDEVTIITISLVFSAGVSASNLASFPSNQSYTGLSFTPNAQVMEYGGASFTFSHGLPWDDKVQDLDSLKVSLGIIDGLEAHGRIVTHDYSSNCFKTGCGGIRDLSMSFKYQLPNFWGEEKFNIALGVQDLGGAGNKLNANYFLQTMSYQTFRFAFLLATVNLTGSLAQWMVHLVDSSTNLLILYNSWESTIQ